MTRPTWPEYALSLAKVAATRSEDPYLQVGACILREDNSVASLGYNGAPAGIDINWDYREERRPWVIHAEQNALRYVAPGEGRLIAVTHLPCARCMLQLAAYRIGMVWYSGELENPIYDRREILSIAATARIHVYKDGEIQR